MEDQALINLAARAYDAVVHRRQQPNPLCTKKAFRPWQDGVRRLAWIPLRSRFHGVRLRPVVEFTKEDGYSVDGIIRCFDDPYFLGLYEHAPCVKI